MAHELEILTEAVIKLRGFGATGDSPDEKKHKIDFINKIYSWGSPTLSPNEVIMPEDVTVTMDYWDNKVWLKDIMALDARQGNGTKVLKKIVDLADNMDITLYLTAEPFGTNKMPKGKLKQWYKKYGFVAVKGRADRMVREPK